MNPNKGIKLKIRLQLIVCLALLGSLSLLFLVIAEQQITKYDAKEKLKSFENLFPDLLKTEASALHAQIEILMESGVFQKA